MNAHSRKVHHDGLAAAHALDRLSLKALELVEDSKLAIQGRLAIDAGWRMLAEVVEIFDRGRSAPDIRHMEEVRRDEKPSMLHALFGQRCLARASRAFDDIADRLLNLLEWRAVKGVRRDFVGPLARRVNLVAVSRVDFVAAGENHNRPQVSPYARIVVFLDRRDV